MWLTLEVKLQQNTGPPSRRRGSCLALVDDVRHNLLIIGVCCLHNTVKKKEIKMWLWSLNLLTLSLSITPSYFHFSFSLDKSVWLNLQMRTGIPKIWMASTSTGRILFQVKFKSILILSSMLLSLYLSIPSTTENNKKKTKKQLGRKNTPRPEKSSERFLFVLHKWTNRPKN